LRPADDQALREIDADQVELLQHFLAFDEFRDGFDSHIVALLVDRFDLFGGGERAVDVLDDAIAEFHEIGLEQVQELERAVAAVETGKGEAAAGGLEQRLEIFQVLGVQ
jgi:hypothetical protein